MAKWKTWSAAKAMTVEFDYWGEHEIFRRLSEDEHRGRHWFWFDDRQFSLQWFRDRLAEAVADAGDRYTPELNVELPISNYFEALGRTRRFFDEAIDLYRSLKKAHSALSCLKKHSELETAREELSLAARNLLSFFQPNFLNPSGYPWEDLSTATDWDGLRELVSRADRLCEQIDEKLRDLQAHKKSNAKIKGASDSRVDEPLREEIYYLSEFSRKLADLAGFCSGSAATLSSKPALLLAGKAGQGKTHLFCDVAERDMSGGHPCVLLHGGHFNDGEPWSQIIRELGLSCDREELLGALEAAARASRCRILILIDALNEGEGRKLWRKHLGGMLATLGRFPWLGIAVSVRSSYEDLVLLDDSVRGRLLRVEHVGFREHEHEATLRFFNHYGIQPTLPLLVPEFSNPLFLKLLCQGLKNEGLTQVPIGLHGITAVRNFFIDAVNKRLAMPERLDYDPKAHPVKAALEKLVVAMASRNTRMLSRDEAVEIVSSILPSSGYETSLFRQMVAEGVLAEDRSWADSGPVEIVRFTYERFGDHLITQHLLEKHLDIDNPRRSFAKNRILGRLCKDENSCWQNQGLIEALSIQLPERIKRELVELAPHAKSFRPVAEAFIESIVWRNRAAFSEASFAYINSHVLRYVKWFDDFFDASLIVAPIPDHPLNADRLHQHLMKFGLADRDVWWSTFLHRQWGSQGAVDRLVDWAWSESDKTAVPDDAVRLTGIAIAWFLTSGNRYLRDRATKGLVRLFERRVLSLCDVLRAFRKVDDPYVRERLLAVAYGCALRSTETKHVAQLAQEIYDWVFKDGRPPPHILLRDYARGVVEKALHLGAKLKIDVRKIRPPYKSDWPALKIPDAVELKDWEWKEGISDAQRSKVKIYHSVIGSSLDNDFSRYAIGDLLEWSNKKIGGPQRPTRKQLYDKFVKSLTKRQTEAWDTYQAVHQQITLRVILQPIRETDAQEPKLAQEKRRFAVEQAEQSFSKTLRKDSRKDKLFRKVVKPYLGDPREHFQEDRFDGQLARRWMMARIVELGWTVERFGEFDWNVNRYAPYDRREYGSGRIGEKYQWIALHELLARLSDNFKLHKDKWSDGHSAYEGPWQLNFLRDIDPSNLLPKTAAETWSEKKSNTWWFPVSYSKWDCPTDGKAWLRTVRDLPSAESLIQVANTGDGSQWFVMEAFYIWQQPAPPGEEPFELPRREIWYMLRSYLVRKTDAAKVFAWAKRQNFMGRWMPESHSSSDIILGEFFWAPAFRAQNTPYFGREGWTRLHDDRIPAPVLVTTDGYFQESGSYDCSLDETINMMLPCKLLADGMGLRWKGVEGEFLDSSGGLVAFDPSVRTPGPGALLIRREALLDFLESEEYQVIWTVLGEKQLVGGAIEQERFQGRLEISGAFTVDAGTIEGSKSTRFVS